MKSFPVSRSTAKKVKHWRYQQNAIRALIKTRPHGCGLVVQFPTGWGKS